MEVVTTGWELPATSVLIAIGSRLLSATLLGALIGLERESHGMSAGLRTHMMVALGTTLFTLVPLMEDSDALVVSTVVKGIAAGIGFLGAGSILKREDHTTVKGLTTAASIWLTAAVGVACGAGRMWLALFSVLLSLVILGLVGAVERRLVKSP